MNEKTLQHDLNQIAQKAIPDDKDLWPEIRNQIHSEGNSNFFFNYRMFVYSAITLLILLVFAFTFPGVRAWAANFIREFGGMYFSDEESFAQEVAAKPEVVSTLMSEYGSDTKVAGIHEIQELEAQFGAPIYVPRYIPEGYELQARDIIITEDVVTVFTEFKSSSPIIRLSILQGRAKGEYEAPMGVEPLEVTVRNQSGWWFESAPVGYQADAQESGKYEVEVYTSNILVWEEGDQYILISSNVIPLEETLRIAESLAFE